MCVRFRSIKFNKKELMQHNGLAIGSSLSLVTGFCLPVHGNASEAAFSPHCWTIWLRYVDNVIIVDSKLCNLNDLLRTLDGVQPKIQLTLEK